MRAGLTLLPALVLVCSAAAADPVGRFAGAREPGAVREAAAELGKALNAGCCFGREREIARIAEGHLARCPRDPALVSALEGVLGAIGRSVALQDPALARRVFVELPGACIARGRGPWHAYAELLMHGGLAVAQTDPGALSDAISRLVDSARADAERTRQIVEWLDYFHLELSASLPPLDETAVDALIDGAGSSLHKLPELFSRLPGRAGTEALLRLAERRDLVVPPELARWVDAGGIRSDALRKLEPKRLRPQDLERVRRLASDADERVAGAARTLLAAGTGSRDDGPSATQAGAGADAVDGLIGELASGDESTRSRAAWRLAEYLIGHPADRTVREALRRVADADPGATVRAHAWRALLATEDPLFTWQAVIGKLRSPASRAQVLETLKRFEMPVPSRLLPTVPDALVEALLELATDPRQDARLRLEALGTARRLGEWALDILSRGYTPDEAERRKTDEARARAFLRRFTSVAEPRVRALFEDPDPGIRREAAYWLAAIPAHDPATAEALLAALDDADPYVRDSAAMALAVVRAAPPGFAARLEARIARGDADANVVRKLRDAMAAALCTDRQAQERLAAVILHRAGDRRLRQALARRCRLANEPARALLERLGPDLMRALTSEGFLERLLRTGELDVEGLVRAEEDPPPWVLVARMLPAEVRDAWLIGKARDRALAWRKRVRLLRLVEDRRAPEIQEALRALLVQGAREHAIEPEDFLSVFAPALGYAGIRTLAETFAQDPEGLERATALIEAARNLALRCVAAASSCGSVPEPRAEDLPWIARQIRAAAGDTRRLGLLVRLLRVYALGQKPELQRQAWELGITPVLLEAMQRPGGCTAVQPAIHSLLGRMTPPRCD